MAHFYRFETVDIPIILSPEGVLDGYKHIVVSLKKNNLQIDKTEEEIGIDIENNTLNVSLSQEETSQFSKGKAEIQVNIYYETKERDTSAIANIEVLENLYKQVIEDE